MRETLIAVAVAALLTACTTTPTTPPQLDLPAASANPVSATALERWWKAFNDPTLDALVDEALAHNLDLASAMARVETARAQVTRAQSDLFPTVDLGAGANRSRSTQSGTNPLPQGFSPYSND